MLKNCKGLKMNTELSCNVLRENLDPLLSK